VTTLQLGKWDVTIRHDKTRRPAQGRPPGPAEKREAAAPGGRVMWADVARFRRAQTGYRPIFHSSRATAGAGEGHCRVDAPREPPDADLLTAATEGRRRSH